MTTRISLNIYRCLVTLCLVQLTLFGLSTPVRSEVSLLFVFFSIFAWFRILKEVRVEELPQFDKRTLWALLFFFILGLCFYLGVFQGHLYNGDWPKHRSVMLSLLDNFRCPSISGFDLNVENLQQYSPLRLIYYYAPYFSSIFFGKFLLLFGGMPQLDLLKAMTIFFLIFQLVVFILSLPYILKFFAETLKLKLDQLSFIIFGLYLFVWGGADFWWAKFIYPETVKFGDHMDGIFGGVYVGQVHGTASLLIWVTAQLASVALALAIVSPFLKKMHWPSLFLCFSAVFAGSTLSVYILCLYLLLAGLEFNWLSASNWNKKMIQRLAILSVSVLFFYFYYKLRIAPEEFILSPDFIANKVSYLSFITREFSFFLIVLALAIKSGVLNWKKALIIAVAIMLPTPFYLGIYNGLILKAYVGFTFLTAVLMMGVLQNLPRLQASIVNLIALAIMLPLFINEMYFSNRVETIYLEFRKPFVLQYAGVYDKRPFLCPQHKKGQAK